METRSLGKTGLKLPVLSFGASSLGQEFRQVKLDEALESVRVALDCGLNFIDTSPFYGRGMSEVLLGIALREVPRESYTLCTKLGRYDLNHFDFNARRVVESVDVSLHRELSWNALTQLYELKARDGGEVKSFATVQEALAAAGEVVDWPVVVEPQLDPDATYQIRVRAGYRRGSPARLRALLPWIDGWNSRTEWHAWVLPR